MKCCGECKMPLNAAGQPRVRYCMPFGTCGGAKGIVELDFPPPMMNPPEATLLRAENVVMTKGLGASALAALEDWKARYAREHAHSCKLADTAGDLRSENRSLMVENAELRRRIEKLERKAGLTGRPDSDG